MEATTTTEAAATQEPLDLLAFCHEHASEGVIVRTAKPGVATESMRKLEAKLRRMGKRNGLPVHVNRLGSGSLLVRAARS